MPKDFLSFLDGHIAEDRVVRFAKTPADVGEYDTPAAAGVIEAGDVDEVVRIVALANEQSIGPQLHPFSTGRNWGLGSKKSPSANSIYLDLHRLNKIREINVDHGYAVIEPGVTQGEISRRLQNTSRIINVTASSASTSFLGNALDRGVGLSHQKTADLLGLEVILPDASLKRIGWWPEPQKQSALYPHGVGPSLVQLFCQANFCVVTAAVIRLLPRPERNRVAHVTFDPAKLPGVIDLFQKWYAQGLIRGVLKIYDETSTLSYGASKGEFLAHLPIAGKQSLVAALSSVIEEEFGASVNLLNTLSWNDDPADPYAEDIVAQLVSAGYAGNTKYNDQLLKATLGVPAQHVDEEGRGWIFFLPLVPFSGAAIREAYQHFDTIFKEVGVKCGATINGLNDHIIDLVVSIKFDRTNDQIEKAHRALELLYARFESSGFYPYRLDVAHPVSPSGRSAPNLDIARTLKGYLDPKRIFADGRYI